MLERLADKAARELGLERAEIRRRNLIPASAMPYKTPVGPTYDCGDFPRIFQRALEPRVTHRSRKDEKKARRAGGCAAWASPAMSSLPGVAPSRLAGMMGARVGFYESAQVRVAADGSVTLARAPTTTARDTPPPSPRSSPRAWHPDRADQGHRRRHRRVPFGTGTFGSRSIAVGGSALYKAAREGASKRASTSRRTCSRPPAATSSSPTAVSGRRHRPRGAHCDEVARAAYVRTAAARDARAGPRRERVLRSAATSRSPTARTCASSRSIRRPAKSRSSAITRSTTSAP